MRFKVLIDLNKMFLIALMFLQQSLTLVIESKLYYNNGIGLKIKFDSLL